MSQRILLVSHETTLSGAPIQLVDLAIRLQQSGWQVVVAATEEGPIGKKLDFAGVKTVFEPELLLDPNLAALRRITKQSELVIANTIAAWQAVQAAHLEKVPVIWYLHETLVGRRLIEQISEIRQSLRLADMLVVPTRSTACVYEMWTNRPLEVVPYGIATPSVTPPVRNDGLISFVSLGTFERRKGQDVLVEAIGKLRPEIRARGTFKMAGRNCEEVFHESVSRKAADYREIEVLGSKEHDEALALLAAADVLICPSRDETMPIVILEAMSLGKAVISTDVGGIREWLRNDLNGLMVPPENPLALKAAIERCLCQRDLVQRLGTAARRTYERHFTLDRYTDEFERVIRRTLNNQVDLTPDIRSLDWPERYSRWVREYDLFQASDRLAVERGLRSMRRLPLISVILPVYNPDVEFLQRAIDSIRNQVYSNWELCVADDASTDPRVRQFLTKQSAGESRIKVVFREVNGHIAACSNSALAIATGGWCVLLDQDDALPPHALAEIAHEIEAHPNAALIYSDEDKIDAGGNRSYPFFKTDWNPELFRAQNYINHLGAYRTSLLHEVGGFQEGFEGSQDYDLALRCVERIQAEQIRHIPRILYHWRTVPGSLADKANAKPYAREAARRAIAAHLERQEIAGRVEPCPQNRESHRVTYALSSPPPLVTIVIAMRDRVSLLQRCVESMCEKTGDDAPFEIVIVDNGSRELETAEYLKELANSNERVRTVRDDGPFNFSRLNNFGARSARGSLVLFLNNDIEVTDGDWLREMVSHLMQPGVGAVGARLWYPDGSLQHGGVVLGLGGVASHAHHRIPQEHPGYFNRAFLQQDYSAITAACLLVRKSVFNKLGGFDELNVGINFNDVDFCLRLKALGWRVVWTPYANLVHAESASRGMRSERARLELFMGEATYMQRKWGKELFGDPFYNPNLCLELPAFYPAFPPRRAKTSFSVRWDQGGSASPRTM